MAMDSKRRHALRETLHEVIFESHTPAGRAFDVALLLAIGLSVLAVCLESVAEIRSVHGPWLHQVEWVLTVLFTVEYVLRLACVDRPLRYAVSFFGVVDLLAIMPTYLSLVLGGVQALMVIRALRLLRIFRILHIPSYMQAGTMLWRAMAASRPKIVVFLIAIVVVNLIVGTLMHLVEPTVFTSIPLGVYWATVTMTTVGFGDVAPVTALGRGIAAALMLMGYGVLAVPTGIVAVELAYGRTALSRQVCSSCSAEGHDVDASFCKRCGAEL
ncbi:ion transporter [Planctomycetota bacterium]